MPYINQKCYRCLGTVPAVGLMLYAGIRTQETARLHRSDIDLSEGEIIIPARHSKTGGGRHVPICPALRAIPEQAQYPAVPAPRKPYLPRQLGRQMAQHPARRGL